MITFLAIPYCSKCNPFRASKEYAPIGDFWMKCSGCGNEIKVGNPASSDSAGLPITQEGPESQHDEKSKYRPGGNTTA